MTFLEAFIDTLTTNHDLWAVIAGLVGIQIWIYCANRKQYKHRIKKGHNGTNKVKS